MQKRILVFREDSFEQGDKFREKVFEVANLLADAPEVTKLKIVISEDRPLKFSIIPFSNKKVAVVSVHSDANVEMESIAGQHFSASEAIPVSYHKSWPDGEPTPGVCLLTFFKKKKDLDYDEFISRWHNGHTPLSLKIHPLWNYNRNVVRRLSNEFEDYDGIVEEQMASKKDLLNPFRFFGNPLVIIPNMMRVYFDIKGFIDYPSIETYLATEYWLKS
ncbi:MAG: EthD domain-containing protein [Cyclobacteriaceae bacterium]